MVSEEKVQGLDVILSPRVILFKVLLEHDVGTMPHFPIIQSVKTDSVKRMESFTVSRVVIAPPTG